MTSYVDLELVGDVRLPYNPGAETALSSDGDLHPAYDAG